MKYKLFMFIFLKSVFKPLYYGDTLLKYFIFCEIQKKRPSSCMRSTGSMATAVCALPCFATLQLYFNFRQYILVISGMM